TVRQSAIDAAGSLRIRDALPGLSRLANDKASRLSAIRALTKLADPHAATIYLSAIEDRDPVVREAGERALVMIRDSAPAELASFRRSGALSRNAAAILERALHRFVPVSEWQIIGPFPRNTPRLFSDPSTIDLLQPVAGERGQKNHWSPRAADRSTGCIFV